MFRTWILLLCVVYLTFSREVAQRRHPSVDSPSGDLRVTLKSGKQTYELGQPVDLHVTLENRGKVTVFVGQSLGRVDWIYSAEVRVSDENGRVSPELHWMHPFMADYDPSQPFIDALTRWWVPLPPACNYGTVIQIDGTDFDFLKKPGRYKIEVTYISYGMEEPLNYNRLAASPEEIKKLPYGSWRGRAKSNSILVQLVRK